MSYNAGISACETGEQSQVFLALLCQLRRGHAAAQRNELHTALGLAPFEKVEQLQVSMALLLSDIRRGGIRSGTIAVQRDLGGEDGGQRHQLQRWGQRPARTASTGSPT